MDTDNINLYEIFINSLEFNDVTKQIIQINEKNDKKYKLAEFIRSNIEDNDTRHGYKPGFKLKIDDYYLDIEINANDYNFNTDYEYKLTKVIPLGYFYFQHYTLPECYGLMHLKNNVNLRVACNQDKLMTGPFECAIDFDNKNDDDNTIIKIKNKKKDKQ